MDTTRAQQKAMDDELEPTLQVALDALKLTPFYNAFEITADLNGKSHTVNVDNSLNMLKICPKLQGQEFEEKPSLEHLIYLFLEDRGHTESLCLSRAQILWGMYHNKTVDYVYLLWEDLVYQVENKNSKKNNVIVDYFMANDQAIPRRNKMFWHYARDEFMFTTVRVISKHQDTYVYGAILPQHLTNQAMLESEAYMTYRTYATGEKNPKPKSTKKKADSESSPKTNPTQASKGKRIKTLAKEDKAAKIKHSATKSKGLTVLSEVALSKADQIKLATKRSKKEFYSSHASGSGDGVDIQSKVPDEQQHTVSSTNEGAGDKPKIPDVPEYRSESEEESRTFNQGDDDEENDEHDNDDEDDFVHPNLSTYKADNQEEEKEDEKANDDDEVSSDQKVSTPSDYELTEEEENQEDENDAEMTRCSNNQDTQRGFDSDFYPKFQSEIIPVNVSVSATTETPSSDTTIPQPPIPIIQSQQQTYDSTTTTTIPTTTLPEIPNFASLFDERCSECGYSAKIQQAQRKTAQAENDEFLKQIDSNIKAIIKDQVKAQVSKIMPKVEKYVTESLGAEVLGLSSNQTSLHSMLQQGMLSQNLS
ncbi:hypothetical protein Tco_0992137 [Tanacetum coccineum]|uniref:Uncharacterized protein n=1 Tax=Tanacetum coccineum TaxID=301880 RepID=A0ABQ5F1Y5_9ASTR